MSEKITVIIAGEERELFMSFGLLQELTKIIVDPAQVPAITLDADVRLKVLAAVLAERKPSGKVLKAVADPDDIDITLEDAENILAWAQEQVLGFFVRSMKKTVQASNGIKEIEDLVSSLDGSQGSRSKKR